MGWVHDVPEDDLYDHEGYTVAVLAGGSEPDPLVFQQGGHAIRNSSWSLYDGKEGRPLAAAVRAACECGWRSAATFPVDFEDQEATEGWEDDSGPCKAWQDDHIGVLLGTAMPTKLREALRVVDQLVHQLATERPLIALTAIGKLEKLVGNSAPTAGVGARKDGAAWSSIGRALGTTRQAAYQRFARHLPPEEQ